MQARSETNGSISHSHCSFGILYCNKTMNINAYLPSKAAELVQLLGLLPHPEGGFFLETFRSGSTPMSSKGQTDLDVAAQKDLVTTSGRSHCRPDQDNRRNCLTSIYWVPTFQSPTQPLVCNESDHVHFYQGGLPMEYRMYDPRTRSSSVIETVILGPDIRNGHVLQYPIAGGMWKCARLMTELANQQPEDDNDAQIITADYSIVSEAVGPGFDFYDFHFVSMEELEKQPADVQVTLRPFLQASLNIQEIADHYDSREVQAVKTQERL
jgi:predicted cupin superfamily sugar epimerase